MVSFIQTPINLLNHQSLIVQSLWSMFVLLSYHALIPDFDLQDPCPLKSLSLRHVRVFGNFQESGKTKK